MDKVHTVYIDDEAGAKLREKQLKKWNRPWKMRLIETMNPHWKDLFETLY